MRSSEVQALALPPGGVTYCKHHARFSYVLYSSIKCCYIQYYIHFQQRTTTNMNCQW